MLEDNQAVKINSVKSIETDTGFQNNKSVALKWLQISPIKSTDMDTIFFHNDRFELIVDARGYRPEDLKCVVNPTNIEVSGQRHEIASGAQRQLETTRNYELPSPIIPQQAVCCLSSEGILLVAVPWLK